MADSIVIEERLATREISALLAVGLIGSLIRRRRERASRLGRALERCRRGARLMGVPLVGALLWLSSCVVVRVVEADDGRRLEVLYGPNGVIRQTFSASEILSADVGDAPLWRWGGLGYRGSLRLFKRAALVTRRGEALVLELTRGRRFVVTVDEPGAFASALSD